MRILLLAHAYPPLATPQALRWHYFTRELARRGHDVHVLAPELVVNASEAIAVPAGVTVHRCLPGGLSGRIARHRRNRQRDHDDAGALASSAAARGNGRLNWKGRIHRSLDNGLGYFMYPDSSAEWLPPARELLARLMRRLRPEALISSHEPAGVLQLALEARGDTPWIADLGDPVLAAYTPARWRRRARALEARVCAQANRVIVTTETTRALLARRHAEPMEQFVVIPQGFDADDPLVTAAPATSAPDAPLELLYSGRFYRFRDPTELIRAVNAVDGVRLGIASPELPARVHQLCVDHADRIELLGQRSHAATRALQRRYDVLVNIGNTHVEQTPGKLYEYFGAQRPILHLSSGFVDPSEPLLLRHRRGWTCDNNSAAIAATLEQLLQRKRCNQLDAGLDLGLDSVGAFTWQYLGAELERTLQSALATPAGSPSAARTDSTLR